VEQHFPDDEVTSASGLCFVIAGVLIDLGIANRRHRIYLRPVSPLRTHANSIRRVHIYSVARTGERWRLLFPLHSAAHSRLVRISMYTQWSMVPIVLASLISLRSHSFSFGWSFLYDGWQRRVSPGGLYRSIIVLAYQCKRRRELFRVLCVAKWSLCCKVAFT
jgi:hypothetical protein